MYRFDGEIPRAVPSKTPTLEDRNTFTTDSSETPALAKYSLMYLGKNRTVVRYGVGPEKVRLSRISPSYTHLADYRFGCVDDGNHRLLHLVGKSPNRFPNSQTFSFCVGKG